MAKEEEGKAQIVLEYLWIMTRRPGKPAAFRRCRTPAKAGVKQA